MHPDLLPVAFGEGHLRRLREVVDLVVDGPVTDWADPGLADRLADVEVVIGHWGCPPLDALALDRLPRLRLLAYAAGTVKLTVDRTAFERGVVVTSAAAANAVPVAEYTLAAILWANKGVLVSRERYRDPGVRIRRPRPVGNLAKTVGVVGASRVGRRLIGLLEPFDLEVLLYDPWVDAAGARDLGVTLVDDLDELCRRSDVVTLHAPDVPATRRMIDARRLAAMRDGAVLINTARGALVDTDALVAELRTGRITAVLDVTDPEPLPPDHPLLGLPNAFVTPHVAGAQGSELVRLADAAVTEVERHCRGEPPLHPVDPSAWERIA